MKHKSITINYREYNTIDELPVDEKLLLSKAIEATSGSYAPYSKFHVGSAVLLSNGEIVKGANQENAAFPSGLCAERTAMFYAHTHYPNESIEAIAITAIYEEESNDIVANPPYPCGACRQVMAEYEKLAKKPIRIIIGGGKAIQVFEGIECMMPFTFTNI